MLFWDWPRGSCQVEAKNDEIAVTVMSNLALDGFLKKEGVAVTRTQVGDRYVVKQCAKRASVSGVSRAAT